MKRIALILAGAATFDLGVMVVAAKAQQATPDRSPQAPGSVAPGDLAAPCCIDHKEQRVGYLKIDRVNTVEACMARKGQVVTRERVKLCRLPDNGGPVAPDSAVSDPAAPRK